MRTMAVEGAQDMIGTRMKGYDIRTMRTYVSAQALIRALGAGLRFALQYMSS